MQLKGLALKKTPIYADSAVIRHDRLDEGDKGEKRLRRNAEEKTEAMTSIFKPTPLLRV